MIEDQPAGPPVTPHPLPPDPVAPSPPPPPGRWPFWGYSDVVVFIGLFLASMLASVFVNNLILSRLHLAKGLSELVLQCLLYLLCFSALAFLFRIQYGRPFWESLGWTSLKLSPAVIVALGAGTAIIVGFVGALIKTPNAGNLIVDLLEDPKSRVFIVLFAITLAPMAEELIFRGFLQPLFVRSFGAWIGILAAAVPFGILHFQEYGNEWRHVILVSLAGAAFGWMRQRTGSTKASTLMHASYNALELLAYFASKEVTH